MLEKGYTSRFSSKVIVSDGYQNDQELQTTDVNAEDKDLSPEDEDDDDDDDLNVSIDTFVCV